MTLKKQLARYGYDGPAWEFRELVQETAKQLAPSWSIDEFLCHWTYVKKLGRIIREKTGTQVPSSLVARTLMNTRKHSCIAT